MVERIVHFFSAPCKSSLINNRLQIYSDILEWCFVFYFHSLMGCTILSYIKRFLAQKGSSSKKSSQAHLDAQSTGRHHVKKAIKSTEKSRQSPKKRKPVSSNISSQFIHDASNHGIQPRVFHKNALSVVEKLQRNGYEAYIVGGCIRDILLGKQPKDFDVATNAHPEQIKAVFQRQCRLIGRRFRLAHIMFGRDIIEVATFRGLPQDHHSENMTKQSSEGMLLRDNVYGTLDEDAQRRDFTVNALYYNPRNNTLIDFFEGIEHIEQGKLLLIGDPETRYTEDPVRMLRSIRFMAKLDMFLDKSSEQPIKSLAHLLQNIPAARLFDESLKLLQSGYGFKTYQLLRQYNLFEQLFPTLSEGFTKYGDSNTEQLIELSLRSTDERIKDDLGINPAFLFAAFYWYPLRERMETLKNEGDLNNHDALGIAAEETIADICKALAVPKRLTAVMRDIWYLQQQFTRRFGKNPEKTFTKPKFRAGYDLLLMRAKLEGGELIELSQWWHEYQLSNQNQRDELIKTQNTNRASNGKPNGYKRKNYRRKRTNKNKANTQTEKR